MGRVSSIIGDPWHRCDRCGCDRRVSELVPQEGRFYCRSGDCVDQQSAAEQQTLTDAIIASKLEDSENEMAPVSKLRDSDFDTSDEPFTF